MDKSRVPPAVGVTQGVTLFPSDSEIACEGCEQVGHAAKVLSKATRRAKEAAGIDGRGIQHR